MIENVIPARSILAFLLFCFAAPQAGRGPGGVASYPAGSAPPCDQSRRGAMIVSLGGAGSPDSLEVCLRDGAGRFSWVAASNQNPNTFSHTRMIGGCPIFPDNNVWNSTVDKLPVSGESQAIIATFAAARLGTVPEFWINLADSKTPSFPVLFAGASESDSGKYPIAANMKMEGTKRESYVSGAPFPNSDSHLLVIQTDQCKLYEIFALGSATPPYKAGSGAIYDLMDNKLRPNGWTSADASGMPIWPGILTYDELYGGGEIRHMLRFSVNHSRNTFVWPARHYASHDGSAGSPPMGSRWRLKASVDENVCRANDNVGKPLPPEMKRLIRALKHYGMILADNGAPIRITTDADARWANGSPTTSPEYVVNGWTHCLTGRDFEVVDASPLMVNPDTAEAIIQ
jgi:hypothetical protein